MEKQLQAIFDAVLSGQMDNAVLGVQQALDSGMEANQILNDGLIAAMTEVGDRFEKGEYYVPEMLVAARAMQAGLATLKPSLIEDNVQSRGTIVIGTVRGDLHEIGKNLVGMMYEGAGYEVIDLGSDVPPEKFADAARTHKADVVGMSALLTTTMIEMPRTIEALERAGVRRQVKVIIGGAPVTKAYADEIGAEGYAKDASQAVAVVRTWL